MTDETSHEDQVLRSKEGQRSNKDRRSPKKPYNGPERRSGRDRRQQDDCPDSTKST